MTYGRCSQNTHCPGNRLLSGISVLPGDCPPSRPPWPPAGLLATSSLLQQGPSIPPPRYPNKASSPLSEAGIRGRQDGKGTPDKRLFLGQVVTSSSLPLSFPIPGGLIRTASQMLPPNFPNRGHLLRCLTPTWSNSSLAMVGNHLFLCVCVCFLIVIKVYINIYICMLHICSIYHFMLP